MTQPSFVPIIEADQVRPAYRLRTPLDWRQSRVAELRGPESTRRAGSSACPGPTRATPSCSPTAVRGPPRAHRRDHRRGRPRRVRRGGERPGRVVRPGPGGQGHRAGPGRSSGSWAAAPPTIWWRGGPRCSRRPPTTTSSSAASSASVPEETLRLTPADVRGRARRVASLLHADAVASWPSPAGRRHSSRHAAEHVALALHLDADGRTVEELLFAANGFASTAVPTDRMTAAPCSSCTGSPRRRCRGTTNSTRWRAAGIPGHRLRPAGLLARGPAPDGGGLRRRRARGRRAGGGRPIGLRRASTWSATTGAPWWPGWWRRAIPERVRTLTAVSVPHPVALLRAPSVEQGSGDDDQRQRSSYIEVFRARAAWPSEPCSARTARGTGCGPCSTPAGCRRTPRRSPSSWPPCSSPAP